MTASRSIQAVVLLLLLLVNRAPAQQEEQDFKPLFNGKNLDGWVRTNTPEATWKLKDGMLVCSGKPIGELRTRKMYQNFIMEIEWRHMKPRGNAGIFIWADDITARGVPFHRGIEVQVLENAYGNSRVHTTHGDIFPIHGAKMTPINGRGGSRAFPSESRSKPSPEWNHYRIECRDGEISLAVNGKVVTRGSDCSPRKGYICLESEGGIVHYRNAKVLELPDTPVEPQHVAIADRGYRSIYSGLDLSGWNTAKENAGHWKANDWVLTYDGKSQANNKALISNESYGNFGFVMDFRLKQDSGLPLLQLRGPRGLPLVLTADGPHKLPLNKPGQWNRLEGAVDGNKVTISVNGQDVPIPPVANRLPESGPLRIVPDGTIDFANLYVRDLVK
ncbi:MAG: DUF1080 domain-containing protein [Planctomycetota bacterium]|nr:DUF1080 domain-containing protein [Planctomycetota bacterium]